MWDDEDGLFVFLAKHTLTVRSVPTIADECKTDLQVPAGELVACDLIRRGQSYEGEGGGLSASEGGEGFGAEAYLSGLHGDGPYLRLSDGTGWLFTHKHGEQMMEEVNVLEGLWAFRVNNPHVGGLALRTHPSNSEDFSFHLEDEQVLLHGAVVWVNQRVDAADGVTFVRVQGTPGWLFTSRDDQQTLFPLEGTQEAGMAVYRTRRNLVVHSVPDVTAESCTGMQIAAGELVAVDLKVANPEQGSVNGPFLRLTDRAGWLFEAHHGEKVMDAVPMEHGLWAYRVNNNPAGLALRRHPTDANHLRTNPKEIFPHGSVVWADRKVQVGSVGYVHVQGTKGWLFTSRGSRRTLVEVERGALALEEVVVPGSARSRDLSLPLDSVRQLAGVHGYTEVKSDAAMRVAAFQRQDGRSGAEARVTVYYTTGTVSSALSDPSTPAETRPRARFRWGCSLADLDTVLEFPGGEWLGSGGGGGGSGQRPHAGGDSAVAGGAAWDASRSLVEAEEPALRGTLVALDREEAAIHQQRASILAYLKQVEQKRRSGSERIHKAVGGRKDGVGEDDARREKALLAKRRRRGDKLKCFCDHVEDVEKMFDDSVTSIAMGDSATLCLKEEPYGYVYTAGLPEGVHSKLHLRAPPRSPPVLVAMGSNGRFFVGFASGRAVWQGPEHEEFDAVVRNVFQPVVQIAFGEHSTSYFVKLEDGDFFWCNVPEGLNDILSAADHSERDIYSVSLGPSGEWFVAWDDGDWTCDGISEMLREELNRLQERGKHVRDIQFGGNHHYCVRYGSYGGAFAQWP